MRQGAKGVRAVGAENHALRVRQAHGHDGPQRFPRVRTVLAELAFRDVVAMIEHLEHCFAWRCSVSV